MATEQQMLTLEQRVKNIFKKVLDIKPEEIKSDAKLDVSLGVDSTEMVEKDKRGPTKVKLAKEKK